MVETKGNSKAKTEPGTAADVSDTANAPVTYSFDGRAFIVQPVFKEKPANTLSATLLRLMRSDLEES